MLEISGKEKTYWITDKGSKHQKKHNGKNPIINSKNMIFIFDNFCAPVGQYYFPFQFVLPNWIQPSFIFHSDKDSRVTIKYKVRALMENLPDQNNK